MSFRSGYKSRKPLEPETFMLETSGYVLDFSRDVWCILELLSRPLWNPDISTIFSWFKGSRMRASLQRHIIGNQIRRRASCQTA